MSRNPFAAAPAATAIAVAALALAGCSHPLTEESVRELFDAADQAWLAGRTGDMCRLRSKDFHLDATDFLLARDRIVADLKEAEQVEADLAGSGAPQRGDHAALDLKEFCRMAYEGRQLGPRSTLARSDLRIAVDPDGRRATVRVHYSIRQPVYQFADSSLGRGDVTEHQDATRQSESDEESVVIVGPDGDPVFASTQVTSRSFFTPPSRDSRL